MTEFSTVDGVEWIFYGISFGLTIFYMAYVVLKPLRFARTIADAAT